MLSFYEDPSIPFDQENYQTNFRERKEEDRTVEVGRQPPPQDPEIKQTILREIQRRLPLLLTSKLTRYIEKFNKISSSSRRECSTKYQDQCSTDYETKYQTKCSQSTSRECSTSLETKLEEECSISYKEVCSGQSLRDIVDLKTIGDTKDGKQCEQVSEEICKKVPVSKPVTNCVEVPQQECEEVPVQSLVEKCQKVPVEDCRMVPVRNCRKVPVRKQTKKARRVCS